MNPLIISALSPQGVLRVAINLGNPILVKKDTSSRGIAGVSVDLAEDLARKMGVVPNWIVCDTAAQSVEMVEKREADIGFFAVDPKRAGGIAFTAPYLLIEGSYLVRTDSPLQTNDEVDSPGHRIVVGKGSAYDLYLTRTIKQASIIRSPNAPAVMDDFIAQGAEVAAGIRQQLEEAVIQRGGCRVLPSHFMLIAQAMACPKGCGEEAAGVLHEYVESKKSSGWVAEALQRHQIQGVSVAPAMPKETLH